ncbi:MAG TPA: hypothetical protein PLJ84_01160 [Bacteroidales bacterium]|nr:hypothetical protein [Bacteroidales bacterium]
MRTEIRIKEGLEGLKFKSSTEDIRKLYGEPGDVEELDNPCDGTVESIVWNYPDLGLNFFFDATVDVPVLCTIESDNLDTTLFGKKIFAMKQQEIVQLMLDNGFMDMEDDEETWGELRVSFDDAQTDFYFLEEQLTLVSWSCF